MKLLLTYFSTGKKKSTTVEQQLLMEIQVFKTLWGQTEDKRFNSQDKHTKEISNHGDYLSPQLVCALAFGPLWALMWSLISPQAACSQSQYCWSQQISLQATSQHPTVKIQTRLKNAATFLLKSLSVVLIIREASTLPVLCVIQYFLWSISPFSCSTSNIYFYLSLPYLSITLISPVSLLVLSLIYHCLFSLLPSRLISSRQRHPKGDH